MKKTTRLLTFILAVIMLLNMNVSIFAVQDTENAVPDADEIAEIISSQTEAGTSSDEIEIISAESKNSGTKILGDMNGDSKLNSADAIYLLRHTIMPDKYPITSTGDVNGDDKLNSADAIYLLRHTIMPDKYPIVNNDKGEDVQLSEFTTLVGEFTDREIKTEEVAILAVQDVAEELGLGNAAEELTVTSVNTVGDMTYYRLQQNYQGIPVYGKTFVVVSNDDGKAEGLAQNLENIETIDLSPTVTRETVQEKANAFFETFVLIPSLEDENLVIYPCQDGRSVLAYKMDILLSSESYSVIVDANTGDILKYSSLTYTANTSIPSLNEMLSDYVDVYDADEKRLCYWLVYINGIEHLWDSEANIIYDWDGKQQYTLQDENWIDSQGNQVDTSTWRKRDQLYLLESKMFGKVEYYSLSNMSEPDDVKNNSQAKLLVEELAKAHGFFDEFFGRNSYDDEDGEIIAVIDEIFWKNNAFSKSWSDKTIICIGFKMNITTDLIAHEYMHSVEKSISAMDYQGESGAIMEGYSDIFGELVEDWTINGKLDGDCDWIHGERIMSDPLSQIDTSIKKAYNQKIPYPNQYNGTGFINTTRLDVDHGGVHHNSTVISHAGYSMYKQYGMELKRLANLWYQTLNLIASPDCTFNQLRDYMEMQAIILGYTDEEFAAIQKAFNDVGITGTGYDNTFYDNTFDIEVIGANGNTFNNCSVHIHGLSNNLLGTTAPYHKTYTKIDANLLTVTLPDGSYKIYVQNNENEEEYLIRYILVSAFKGKTKKLTFSTNFKEKSDPYSAGLEYTLSADGTYYTVTGKGSCEDENIAIRPDYKNLPVKAIGEQAFYESNIISVEIPDSVTEIGSYVFARSTELSDVYLPEGLTTIGGAAFESCTKLENISIPKTVTSVSWQAFRLCTSLKSITIPEGITSISDNIVAGCKELETIHLPSTIQSIGNRAFDACSALKEIEFNGTKVEWENITKNAEWDRGTGNYKITCLGDNGEEPDEDMEPTDASYFTFKLLGNDTYEIKAKDKNNMPANVVIPSAYNGKAVTAIGEDAFYYCESLQSVTIPDSVTSIGKWAFHGCESLQRITIPDSVKSIGESAFEYCKSLQSIEIPDSVKSIGEQAFAHCDSLTNIDVDEHNEYYQSIDGNLYALYKNDMIQLIQYAMGKVSPYFVIPDGVTSIGRYAFCCDDTLTSILIPESVQNIADDAFTDCTSDQFETYNSLTNITVDTNNLNYCSVDGNLYTKDMKTLVRYAPGKENNCFTIPDGVTKIGSHAFEHSLNLTRIEILHGVTSIGIYAFNSCKNLQSITIPNSVTSIRPYAFWFCEKLKSVEIPDSIIRIDDATFGGCESLINIQIPDSVTDIGERVFSGCYSLQNITIPNSVTSIGCQAFYSCTSLQSITIPDSVTNIGEGVFSHCDSLQYITIPNSVTSIGRDAFGSCYNLQSITIPDGITVIGNGAFAYCENLQTIIFNGTFEQWDAIEKGKDWDAYTGNYTITYLGGEGENPDDEDVQGSEGLAYTLSNDGESYIVSGIGTCTDTDIVIPATYQNLPVTTIKSYAFTSDAIESVMLPSSISSIGMNAFSGWMIKNIEVDIDNPYYQSIDGNLYSKDGKKFIQYATGKTESYFVIPDGVEIISNSFSDSALETIYFPDSVKTIDHMPFFQCYDLVNIEVSENNEHFKSIDGILFSKDGTMIIKYPIGKTEKHYVLPDGVTEIDAQAFRSTRLDTIEMPDSLTKIDLYAFFDSYIVNIVFHGTKFEWDAIEKGENWDNTVNDYTITYLGESEDSEATDASYFTFTLLGDGTYSIKAKDKNNMPESVVIPSSYNGKAVTVIAEEAFSWCKLLKNIIIPNSVRIIDNMAFRGCENLTCLEIPDSVIEIGFDVFTWCTNLQNITIPDRVTTMYGFSFAGCENLESIIIPNCIKEIDHYAFQNCKKLKNIVIPDNVTKIGQTAFFGCTSLTSIEIPNSVLSIGASAFSGCTSLTNIRLPEEITVLDSYLFKDCTNLISVTISNSVTNISYEVFYSCIKLEKIIFNGTQSEWDAIVKDEDWDYYTGDYIITYLGENDGDLKISEGLKYILSYDKTCYVVSSIGTCTDTDIVIPATYNGKVVKIISDGAFINCTNLQSIVIPNGVTSIYDAAFAQCINLVSVDLPDSLTTISIVQI